MELIVISESKLKIMLTAPDMRRYELDPADVGEADEHTRKAFRHLLDDCGGEIGFKTRGERLFVQLYASKEGGCEIFVTRMGEDSMGYFDECEYRLTEGERALRSKLMQADEDEVLPSPQKTEAVERLYDVRSFGFLFGCLGDTIAVCRRLKSLGIDGGTCYIIENDGGVLLRLDLPVTIDLRVIPTVSFIYEYAREISGDRWTLYVAEHADSIAKGNAVDVLAEF